MVLSDFCIFGRSFALCTKKAPHKTNTHIEVLPPSVYALRGIIFYTVAKIIQNLVHSF